MFLQFVTTPSQRQSKSQAINHFRLPHLRFFPSALVWDFYVCLHDFSRHICYGDILEFKVVRIHVYDIAANIYEFSIDWERSSWHAREASTSAPLPFPRRKAPPQHHILGRRLIIGWNMFCATNVTSTAGTRLHI